MSNVKSRWWINPDLLAALESGQSFSEWLGGRTPVVSSARISKDRKKDAHGVRAQHAAADRAAGRNNLAVVKYYEDNDKSAAKEEVVRDAWELMVREIRQRRTVEGFRITGIICLEVERLYRRAGDYERVVDALMIDDYGILIESGDERDRFVDLYSDTADFDGLIGVARAKSEIRKTRRRMRDSHRTRALEGTAVGGPRRFGWLQKDVRTERPSNTYKNPDEWDVLKEMIRDGAAGKAWETIADGLNARGFLTARGNRWRGEGVRDVVSNPHVCGYRFINGELVRDKDGKPVIGTWDKPATVEQWEQIQERVRQSRGQKGLPVEDADYSPGSFSTRTRHYLYSGFLRCGRTLTDGEPCGCTWTGSRKDRGAGKGETYVYRCKKSGGRGCGSGRNGEEIDRYLTELVLRKHEQLPKNRLAPVVKWGKEEDLRLFEEKKSRLKREWLANNISENDYWEDLPKIDAEINRLRTDQRKHNAEQATKSALNNHDLRARWGEMDLAQKRAAVKEVLVAVVVSPLPKGTPRNGPFDPSLLRPVWRTNVSSGHRAPSRDESAA